MPHLDTDELMSVTNAFQMGLLTAETATFEILKRNGKKRTIRFIPDEESRVALGSLSCALSMALDGIRSDSDIGFRKGIGYQEGSRRSAERCSNAWVLSLDLSNYFPSISEGRAARWLASALVQECNWDASLASTVASTVAKLSSYDGRLYQGSPLSPLLSALVTRGLDGDLRELATRFGVTYTRYADDLTFTGPKQGWNRAAVWDFCREVMSLTGLNGFEVNTDKTHLNWFGRKVILGVSFSHKSGDFRPARPTRRAHRALAHALKKLVSTGTLAPMGEQPEEQWKLTAMVLGHQANIAAVSRQRLERKGRRALPPKLWFPTVWFRRNAVMSNGKSRCHLVISHS